MSRLVLDTSVVVKWFYKEEGREKALEYLTLFKEGKVDIFFPELIKYELGNVLVKGKKAKLEDAQKVLKEFLSLPFIYIPHDLLKALRTIEVAKKLDITYYDASFFVAAESVRGKLITANPKHHKPYKGIEVVSII